MDVVMYEADMGDPDDEGGPAFISVLPHAGGTALLASSTRYFFVWDVVSRENVYFEELTLDYLSDECPCPLVLSDEGHFWASRGRFEFALWSLKTFKPVRTFERHRDYVNAVQPLPGGLVLSASGDCTLRLWDVQTAECLQEVSAGSPRRIALCPSGRRVAIAGASGIELFDLPSLSPIAHHRLQYQDTPLNTVGSRRSRREAADTVVFRSHGTELLCAGHDGIVRSMEPETGRVHKQWVAHGDSVNDLVLLRDGSGFVTGGEDGDVRFWRFDREECAGSLTLGGQVNGLALGPSGQIFAACQDGIVYGITPPALETP